MTTKHVADLLFEARHLKNIPRSGFQFLGTGEESTAEHSFSAAFVAFVMANLEPDADAERLVSMCLVHDLPESRIGDLNYVQKMYVVPDEKKAVSDMVADVPFGERLVRLLEEFEKGETREARLARDADQLALLLELKSLSDLGAANADAWILRVRERLETETGRRLAGAVLGRRQDAWWRKGYHENWREKEGNPWEKAIRGGEDRERS